MAIQHFIRGGLFRFATGLVAGAVVGALAFEFAALLLFALQRFSSNTLGVSLLIGAVIGTAFGGFFGLIRPKTLSAVVAVVLLLLLVWIPLAAHQLTQIAGQATDVSRILGHHLSSTVYLVVGGGLLGGGLAWIVSRLPFVLASPAQASAARDSSPGTGSGRRYNL